MTVETLTNYLRCLGHIQRQCGPLPPGWLATPAEFMLAHGEAFEVTPETFAGPRAKAKHCYRNAGRRASWSDTEEYVEGIALLSMGVPIEHAWLAPTGSAVAIDPTLKAGHAVAFFGIRFSATFLREQLLSNKTWGLLGDYTNHTTQDILYGWDGDGAPPWYDRK